MTTAHPYGLLEYSELLGRRIRTDGLETLGVSSLTLFGRAARAGEAETARALLDYFWEETLRIGDALFQWMGQIFSDRIERDLSVTDALRVPERLLEGIHRYDPSDGDRARSLAALELGDAEAAIQHAEIGRVRYAALHDAYVAWIQQLLTGLALDHGEDAVLEVVLRSYEVLWKQRYSVWEQMTPEQRLQLSVEGMRGHLSGTGRRGDVGVIDEGDRFTMVLDPCGSCGILRRGDPDSGRPPSEPSSNKIAHAWTWFETGKSWYSLHSPIVMEWLDMREGRPPFRPLENCDTSGPCRWFIYKDPDAARPEHYERMGFEPRGDDR